MHSHQWDEAARPPRPVQAENALLTSLAARSSLFCGLLQLPELCREDKQLCPGPRPSSAQTNAFIYAECTQNIMNSPPGAVSNTSLPESGF